MMPSVLPPQIADRKHMTTDPRGPRFSLKTLLALVACFVLGFVARDVTDGLLPTRLPSSTTKLRPGDRLLVEGVADNRLNRHVTVMADCTIDMPLLGVVSVADSAVKDVEKALNKQYAQFYKAPAIRVSHASISEPFGRQ